MRNLISKNFILLIISVILSACGSTLHMHDKKECKQYTRVIINDFKDKASKKHNDPHVIAEGKRFADMIAREMLKKNLFAQVDRNVESDEPALLIDGEIIKYQEGNAALRMIIGLGAGSSTFKAKAHLKDNETKKTIGNIDLNQTSWVPGGVLAGVQDIQSHLQSAATGVANKCSKFKQQDN
ncbi:hypothetical protein phytr_8860 [Candidatus Phycorickettsia trachydisci]|uniref:Lipoprotein n=1 Tax=Candidatus Phycorickettsia trachydisci TaxID=2115978 RepID=A0A2P1P981_9RICK|nr:DUF4410 domain-containing protein [Candidatus Phycorickettsia trachydisci]AVP87817.1 hypothetical protein phytr_8860 [Candidatus Phycorickettsia trachydisci]